MRLIIWAAALLALFVATEANAQNYTIAKPIYMPHQIHDPCSNCGTYCNGYCSLRSFFAPTVTVNGCPIDCTDPCCHSMVDEMACDVHDWIYTRRALRRFGQYCNGSCGQSGGARCDSCTPWDLTYPPRLEDEDVDPFRNDPAGVDSIRVYRISSPILLQPDVRNMFQDRTVLREASLEQDVRSDNQPAIGHEPDLFLLTSPNGARPLSTATSSDRQ